MKDEQTGSRGTTGLIGDILAHVSTLVRKEVDLARAEISQNVNRAGVAIGLLAGALIVALVALNVLAAALVSAISELGLEPGWSALIVGGGLALVAFAMVSKGVKDLKLSSLAPRRAFRNVQRDADTVKEVM